MATADQLGFRGYHTGARHVDPWTLHGDKAGAALRYVRVKDSESTTSEPDKPSNDIPAMAWHEALATQEDQKFTLERTLVADSEGKIIEETVTVKRWHALAKPTRQPAAVTWNRESTNKLQPPAPPRDAAHGWVEQATASQH